MKIKYSKIKSLFHFYKIKKPAPSGFILIFGNRGSGKSAYIAKLFYKWKNKDYNIYPNFYSNINIYDSNNNEIDLSNHKFTDYLDPNDPIISKYKCSTYNSINPVPFFVQRNSIICLDELGIIAHSRDYKNFPKEFINFIKILRKLGILLIANSQNYDIDKTLRLGASELRLQKKLSFINLSYSRKINKFIDINNKSENNNSDSQIVDKVEFAPIVQKGAIKLCFIPFYADLYDSFS